MLPGAPSVVDAFVTWCRRHCLSPLWNPHWPTFLDTSPASCWLSKRTLRRALGGAMQRRWNIDQWRSAWRHVLVRSPAPALGVRDRAGGVGEWFRLEGSTRVLRHSAMTTCHNALRSRVMVRWNSGSALDPTVRQPLDVLGWTRWLGGLEGDQTAFCARCGRSVDGPRGGGSQRHH
jgi:hypothetical protein